MQKPWQARTFVNFRQTGYGQHGRAHEEVMGVTGCAGVGFGAVLAGVFLPVHAAGVVKL